MFLYRKPDLVLYFGLYYVGTCESTEISSGTEFIKIVLCVTILKNFNKLENNFN